jgi:hypothetical protein
MRYSGHIVISVCCPYLFCRIFVCSRIFRICIYCVVCVTYHFSVVFFFVVFWGILYVSVFLMHFSVFYKLLHVFRNCSLCFSYLFRIVSVFVPYIFRICFVVFRIVSVFSPYLFRIFSVYVTYLFCMFCILHFSICSFYNLSVFSAF